MTRPEITDHADGRGITVHNGDGSKTDASVDTSNNVTVRHTSPDGRVEMDGTAYSTDGSLKNPTVVIRRSRD